VLPFHLFTFIPGSKGSRWGIRCCQWGIGEHPVIRQFLGWKIQGILEGWIRAQKDKEQIKMKDAGKEIMDRLERQFLQRPTIIHLLGLAPEG
jgi:hypothetical protein